MRTNPKYDEEHHMRGQLIPLAVGVALILSACAGINTFGTAARAGDTVALALGWNLSVNRQNATVQVTGANTTYTYPPGDANVRFLGNVYPDPASRLVIGRETNQSLGVNAASTGQQLETFVTSNDKDYAQTMLIVNLPATLPVGTATLRVLDQNSVQVGPTISVQILPGTGAPNTFVGTSGSLTAQIISAMERAPDVKTVSFTGSTVPYAIQLDLTRTPGIGTPWLISARGDLKSLSWGDDGTRIRVMLLPANNVNPTNMAVFKFMVGGALSGLAIDAASIKAFDSSGNPVSGVTASLL
jgi:hypothetical protein